MKKIYLFFCLLIIGSALQAQTKTWLGGADSMWHTSGNWDPAGVPSATDSVVFTNSTPISVHFSADANARVINLNGSGNVTFSIINGAASTVYNVNLGAVGSNFTNNALRFSGALNSLTLNTRGTYRIVSPATPGTTTGTASGIVLKVLTGNKATITKTIHLSAFSATLPATDTISSGQVNKIVGVDVGSVIFANGSELRINQRNNGTNGLQVFNGSATNGVVFQSGSIFTNNTATSPDPFATASGDGTAQFLSGSKFYAANGAALTFSATTLSYLFNGRTYGSFFTGSGTSANLVVTNSSSTTTTFLDSLVVNPSGTFTATLTGAAASTPKPTFSFKNIYITSRATAAAAATNLTFRSTNTGGATDSTVYHISGNIDLVSSSANTVGGGTIAFTMGVGTGGSQVTSPNIHFTGNTTLKITKGASGTLVNPNLVVGAGTSGLGTNIFINNGATLNLGDSLTLRTGSQPTRFTIRPTGRLNLIDGARLTTGHNGNFTVESDTTGTGTIGTVTGTGAALLNSFTIQRFIGRNAAWRTLGIPFSISTQVRGGNGTSTASLAYMNSFTVSPAQAYYFNDTLDNGQYGAGSGAVNAGWRTFTTNADSLKTYRGLLLYGSRNSATPIVLSLTGFLNYGTQTIPLSKTAEGNGWNLISNPFVSNISFNSIVSNPANTGVLNSNTIYRVRPLGAGAYSFASYVAGSGTGTNGGSNVIENGGAFFVRAANTTSNLIIREEDKTTDAVGSTTGGVTLMGANDNYNSIRVSLKGANTFTDEVVFVWGRFSKATEAFDNDLDAYDLGASGTHDLSIVDKEGTRYAIFNGADLPKDAETRTYKLATKNLRLGTYEFTVSMPKALDRNNEAYLVDNYLGTAVLVKEGLSHSFQVTADAASKAEGRFQLEVRKKLTSVIDEVATSKTYLLSNPTRNNQFAIHFGSDAQVANWQVVDLSGRVIGTGVFKNVYQGDTRIGELKTLQPGTYLVRLFNDNEPTVVMKLVKL
jgi:hypothetical protein